MADSSIFDHIPAAFPPPGVKSNFVDPVSQQPALIAINVVFLVSMLSIVLIRMYVRGRILHSLGPDDYVCILAAMSSIIFTAVTFASFRVGLGRHLYDIPASMIMSPSSVRLLNATSILYPATIYLVKLSILLLYKRLFTIGRIMNIIINCTIGAITILYLAYIILNIISDVQCIGLYELETYPVCLSLWHSIVAQGVLNAVSDFWILVLPLREISKLQVGRRSKVGIMAIFGVGLVTCGMSLARCVYLTVSYDPADALWYTALALNFTAVEINLAIICACAPTMPAFFKRTKQVGSRLLSSFRTRTSPGVTGIGSKTKESGFGQAGSSDEHLKPIGRTPYHTAVGERYEMHEDQCAAEDEKLPSAKESGILRTVTVAQESRNRL